MVHLDNKQVEEDRQTETQTYMQAVRQAEVDGLRKRFIDREVEVETKTETETVRSRSRQKQRDA